MNVERLKQLMAYLEEEPNDPFTLYAIATEYGASDPEKALAYYETLLDQHPDYVATYYHVAALYTELGRKDDANKAYQRGIEVASRLAKRHALLELQRAYRAFLDEDED